MMDRQVATDSGGWLAGHNAGDPRRHHRRREGMKEASRKRANLTTPTVEPDDPLQRRPG